MKSKHSELIPLNPKTLSPIKQALKGVTLTNCTINIYVSPQGSSAEIKSNIPDKSLLEYKEPQFITPRDASEIHGLSAPFFLSLAHKIGEHDGIRWVLEEGKLAEYLREHPEHRERSLASKKLINPQLLAERGYQILKDESKQVYPDTARVPSANRSRYMSYSELARRLGISYSLYYGKVRQILYKLIKQKPEEVTKKKQEDEEWNRTVSKWNRTLKRDKELGR